MQEPKRPPRRSGQGRSNRSLFRRTIVLMLALGIGLFIPLVGQLYKLQIVEHAKWEEQAAIQQTKSIAVNANRGVIYDREGRIMAMSATVYKLILSPLDLVNSVKGDFKGKEDKLDEDAYKQALYDRRKLIVDWLADTFGYDEDRKSVV